MNTETKIEGGFMTMEDLLKMMVSPTELDDSVQYMTLNTVIDLIMDTASLMGPEKKRERLIQLLSVLVGTAGEMYPEMTDRYKFNCELLDAIAAQMNSTYTSKSVEE